MNLYDVFRTSFPQDRSRPLMQLGSGRTISYGDVETLCASLAARITAAGARPGDRLMMQVEKSAEAVALYLACLRAGVIFIPLNPAYGRNELEYLAGDAAPSVVVCDPASPFAGEDFDPISGERVTRLPVGNTQPDYSIGFSNNLSYRGLQLYALFEAVQGFDVYNQPIQWSTFQSHSGIMDQSGRPEAEQKPVGYYIDGLYGNGGGLAVNSAFVQDASFVKLRELSLRYRAGADRLQSFPVLRGFEGMTFSLTGRNLITWSDYDGYDPEVGRGGGSTGSAALARVDGYNYPNFRTWTFGLELNF